MNISSSLHERNPAMCCHAEFPRWKTLYNLTMGCACLATGGLLTASMGSWWLAAYLDVLFLGLILTVTTVCNRCGYYGRRCGLGIGKVVPLVRRQGRPEAFCRTKAQWLAIALLAAVPVLALVGASRLLWSGHWLLPTSFVVVSLAFLLPHPRWMCGYCAQSRLCPVGKRLVSQP
jgi:hypothetical protein